jgi:hypothetical protein
MLSPWCDEEEHRAKHVDLSAMKHSLSKWALYLSKETPQMTDEIGISITATNSGTEPGRIERLLDVVAIVHSLLDRNVIDMADEDTDEGTYSAFVKALISIPTTARLLCRGGESPPRGGRMPFKTAWETNCEHDVQHVVIQAA